MPSLDQKKASFAPAYVAGIYPRLAAVAMKLGYALAIHGSLSRDLDLIAVPWTEKAVSAKNIVAALAEVFDCEANNQKPEQKPHGRFAWSIPLWWGAYIDISVMPLKAERLTE